jgi:hypothetical protein
MKTTGIAIAAISILALISSDPVSATDITISPGGSLSIQAAVDSASSGDVIILTDGIYFKDGDRGIDFGGKAISCNTSHHPSSNT